VSGETAWQKKLLAFIGQGNTNFRCFSRNLCINYHYESARRAVIFHPRNPARVKTP